MSETQTEGAQAAESAEPKRTRGEALLATRDRKMEELFGGGKRYSVIKRIDLDAPQQFQTPFGHKGRHGFALQLLDNKGQPDTDSDRTDQEGNRFIVGLSVLKNANAEPYNAITNMPDLSTRKPKDGAPAEGESAPAE